MASCGLVLPSSALALAARVSASTWLRPATMFSRLAYRSALILALRVISSNWSMLLALSPAPSMTISPPSTS
ncbi:hypothetical protein D3C85_1857810 [compost metagenome]